MSKALPQQQPQPGFPDRRRNSLRRKKERLVMLLREREKRRSIMHWMKGRLNENGVAITREQHEFQDAIWEDFSERLVVRKAAQIGVSTVFIFKCLWLLERYGYNIIYTLPTLQNDVAKFVPSKVDPIISKNGFRLDRDVLTQKQIGDGFWFFGGTMSEKEGIMTTADCVLHDELDRSNLSNIGTYKSRLGHSTYRRIWEFSNPSAPKRGVDETWLRSDQKHWMLKCECGRGNYGGWQYLSWPESVDYQRQCYVCVHCSREISDQDRRQGQWVAKYPGREISGYWVSQMMAPWIPCSRLIEDERSESQQFFNNFVLGIPWVGADITVTRELILRNLSDEKADTADTFIGVDVGKQLHIVVGNNKGIFRVVAGDWETLEVFWQLYNPRQVVIDALPETTMAKAFRERHSQRVKLCYYRPPTPTPPRSQDVFLVDAVEQTISAHRTEVIDRVIKDFSEGTIRVMVPAREPLLVGGVGHRKGDSFCEHWENMYLVHDEDKNIKSWEHAGQDHFAHATVYYWLARQVAGPREKFKVRVQ